MPSPPGPRINASLHAERCLVRAVVRPAYGDIGRTRRSNYDARRRSRNGIKRHFRRRYGARAAVRIASLHAILVGALRNTRVRIVGGTCAHDRDLLVHTVLAVGSTRASLHTEGSR